MLLVAGERDAGPAQGDEVLCRFRCGSDVVDHHVVDTQWCGALAEQDEGNVCRGAGRSPLEDMTDGWKITPSTSPASLLETTARSPSRVPPVQLEQEPVPALGRPQR